MPSIPFDFSYFPCLQTERLRLREITEADIPALYTLFADPDVNRYSADNLNDIHDAESLFFSFIQAIFDQHTGLRWGITLHTAPDTLIGTGGYNFWRQDQNYGEIGYDLRPAYWGQGIMTEAVSAIIQFGFETMQLNRIEADVTVGNDASARVLQKLGFQEEGLLRQRVYFGNTYHDTRFFSLLRADYQQKDKP